ncbi:50S ribosomal protein L9 [Candidatus Peregrinibacteria bacterium]|nr:50S ribosomal protein L9 [Candidatus Peregrinibacteria bacterium]
MQVVLNQTIKGLGYKGDIVTVKPGYFRNFLLPKGEADAATPSRVKVAEARKEKMVMEKEKVLENAKDVLKKVKGTTLEIKAKANDKGKLFASISEPDVVALLKEQAKLDLAPEFIKMDHLKEVGDHEVLISLGDDMEEKVIVKVVSE